MARHARSGSRQPSPGPSRRPKPPTRPFAEDVIELTDSDEDSPTLLHPRKRQKVSHINSEPIDITSSSAASPDVSVSDLEALLDALEGSPELEPKQKKQVNPPLTDLTNEQDRRELQASSTPLDASVSDGVVATPSPVDTLERDLAQVLEVVPDVQPDHASALLVQCRSTPSGNPVAQVLHVLFEQPYPKVERRKGKRKREDNDDDNRAAKAAEKDFGSKDRPFEGGEHYGEIAHNQLTIDFPRIPVPHIRRTMYLNNSLYAPTYLTLQRQLQENPCPFRLKAQATRPSGKGKQHDAEFDRELAWLQQSLGGTNDKASQQTEEDAEGDDDGECEDGIECGCCFSTYEFDKMIQCPDAHLFCKSCMRSYAKNLLGQHDINIKCMDQSGCKLVFADSELKRFLSEKLLELYGRIKQTKEIEAAGLEGLEECPFCEYKVVIDNPEEKLFQCEREECGAISCRACKKLDHLPKSCKEADEDRGLNARHKVEEAMTEALMRNCPKCKRAFIKEDGCNKMRCPTCGTFICYACRQVIKGYDHFDHTPVGHNRGQASGSRQKCSLWDSVQQRHDREVAEARDKAIKDVEEADPEVDKKQLEIDLPKTAGNTNNRMAQGLQNVGRAPPAFHIAPGDMQRHLERLQLGRMGPPANVAFRVNPQPPPYPGLPRNGQPNAQPVPQLVQRRIIGGALPQRIRYPAPQNVQQPIAQQIQPIPQLAQPNPQHLNPMFPLFAHAAPALAQRAQPPPARHVQAPQQPQPQAAQVVAMARPGAAFIPDDIPDELDRIYQQLMGADVEAERREFDAAIRRLHELQTRPRVVARHTVPANNFNAYAQGLQLELIPNMQAPAVDPIAQLQLELQAMAPPDPGAVGFVPPNFAFMNGPVLAPLLAPAAALVPAHVEAGVQAAPVAQQQQHQIPAPAVQGQFMHRSAILKRR